uniref:Uncharacterized protein n=1 Tax=Strongyloides papillosus TaxID=174720 RepID=A0A0N5C8S9_STREA
MHDFFLVIFIKLEGRLKKNDKQKYFDESKKICDLISFSKNFIIVTIIKTRGKYQSYLKKI